LTDFLVFLFSLVQRFQYHEMNESPTCQSLASPMLVAFGFRSGYRS
jgi:hypothetical protein